MENEMATDEMKLTEEIYQLISNAFIHLDEGERQLMRQFGLTVTQYWALVHLDDTQGRSQGDLAHLLLCDKSNVTSIVDKLEKMDLAERKRGKAGDRRYTRVVLTPRGKQLRTTAIAAHEYMVKARLGVLSTQNLQQLRTSLQKLDGVLQVQFEQGEVATIIENAIEQSRPATTGEDADDVISNVPLTR